MASEVVSILIRVVLVGGLVLAGFWFYKHSTRATIDLGDKYMDPVSFPEGGYSVNTSPEQLANLKSGDVVAYRQPDDPTKVKIARVIGTEGSRVEVTRTDVLVNGKPFGKKFELGTGGNSWTIPEIRVPRGCVFLLADNPFIAEDSKKLGPIKSLYVIGTVKPVS